MGRRKIEIQPITHDRNRSVTFLKRKNGLFKKAYELGVLCSVDVCVIVFSHNGKLHEYCSGDSNAVIERRLKYSGDRDLKRPVDFSGSKSSAVGKDESEPEDEGDSPVEELVTAKSKTNGSRNGAPQGSTARSNSNSYPLSTAKASAHASDDRHGDDASRNHPTPLPPSAHPISIGGPAVPSYLSGPPGSTPVATQHTASIARHHHQLAQHFLVNQIQNINPNLNATTSPQSGALNPLTLFASSAGVPPRGGSATANLPLMPFGTGGGSATNNLAAAYSNAFLNSLVSSHGAGAQQQALPSPATIWPFANNSESRANAQPQPPHRADTRTPSSMSSGTRDSPPPPPIAGTTGAQQGAGAGDAWFEMFMTANGVTGMPGSLHPVLPPNPPPDAQHLDSRSSTPIDGAPLKRPRERSASGGGGEFGMSVDSEDDSGSPDGEEGKKKRKI